MDFFNDQKWLGVDFGFLFHPPEVNAKYQESQLCYFICIPPAIDVELAQITNNIFQPEFQFFKSKEIFVPLQIYFICIRIYLFNGSRVVVSSIL